MSFIGKNIKKIRTVKKMSQSEFAQLFELARPSVGAYEEGRSEPKIETLIAMARHFQLSIDTLLTKELTINELFKFDIFKNEISKEELESHDDKDDIEEQSPLVTLESHLDYIVNYQNRDFINNLPVIHFPFTRTKKSRAFQIEGGEMEYEHSGLHHKDILLCSPVDDLMSLSAGQVYVVIGRNVIMARRFYKAADKLVFKPDNPAYDYLELEEGEITELWKAEAVFSENLQSPTRLEERIAYLEEQMKKVQEMLKSR